MSDIDQKQFMMDMVGAINDVKESHGASKLEAIALLTTLSEEWLKGNWIQYGPEARQ